MRPAHPTERRVGIEWYVADRPGIGGRLRASDEGFRVTELERFPTEPLDADPGDYPDVVFRATLHGWDTNDFAGRLSDELGISRERISWAGTKDKHAVTTQLFSVRGIDPGELPSIRDAELEAVGRAGRPLQFGDLLGNAFELVVAEPDRPDAVDAITDDLRAFGGDPERIGVPNWFGNQRFGSLRPVTHEVGLAIVRGDWREAVLTYVANPFESEPAETRRARETVADCADDGDWQAALEATPRRLGYERTMLAALAESGGTEPADFRSAIERLPENLGRLFVHAAQSYVFNRILSERLDRGLPFDEPVAGDVVCFADRSAGGEFAVPDPDRTQLVDAGRVATVRRHTERDRAFVTAPLVGTETTLGKGDPGEIERAVLADCDLEPADFDLPGRFESTGTRRAVLVRTELAVDREPLVLSFSLPKGAYATAVCREYLQVDPVELG